ncbi:acetyl-CoA carboxylase biotin carboxyl carrier protein subunit [Caldibacillus lycopersici]|uniref:Acetyl-CoA carboxylase biotin carboxyl carrier protein subunit n=1 Tax=Perspicuibacillus lycopersici TaxID=1325689 RepID=A0AAE3IPU9_9BACI|nr:acetyl-CoA carboxylase biotin carboxyl carrier protein subunit [Perspicuibacillus lycopersici]MCU9612211.1 acetyl-CoA carboxylase biotin carboxyl carrier protein subunit [Perspicuibacillus lycopersici]
MMEVLSSMAGTVFQLLVSKGDTVEKGQIVIILESMKMEIPIESEHSGIVQEIYVTEGDFVNEAERLLKLV